jgi:hypothetical protein
MEDFHLTHRITDLRVIDFYQKNPAVDFDRVNRFVVDMLLGLNGQGETELAKELRELRTGLHEAQRAYGETVRQLLAGASADNGERVAAALAKHAEAFADRLAVLLPKTNEEAHGRLHAQIALAQSTLQRDFRDVLLGNKPEGFAEFAASFAASFDAKMAGLQQPVLAVLQANQEALAAKLAAVKDEQVVAKVTGERLAGALHDFLQKQAGSQYRGAASESLLEETLVALYPTASVTRTTGYTGAGDFKLDRGLPFPPVMVENKNYAENVKNTEVQKFLRDATTQRCSAILLSQKSGIVGKRDFEIEVDNGNVLVYVHHAQDQPAKITAAVAVIDALVARLKNLEAAEHTDGTFLPKEALDAVNAEVQGFLQKKNALITSIKEGMKRTVAQVEELHLPELTKILAEKYASPDAKAFPCAMCARTFDSKRSLNAHAKKDHGDL